MDNNRDRDREKDKCFAIVLSAPLLSIYFSLARFILSDLLSKIILRLFAANEIVPRISEDDLKAVLKYDNCLRIYSLSVFMS